MHYSMSTKNSKIGRQATCVISLLMLSSCVGPEKGTAELTIDKLGGYTFTYHGGMAYILGLTAKASGKPITPKDVQGVRDGLQSIAKDREFLSVTPAGFSRVNVNYKAVRKAGQPFKFIGDATFIMVTSDLKTHRLTVRTTPINAKTSADLKKVGYNLDVALTIKSDLPVISSNGTLQKAMLFGSDAYRWQIDLTPRPALSLIAKLPG